jgi:hypothetical protein
MPVLASTWRDSILRLILAALTLLAVAMLGNGCASGDESSSIDEDLPAAADPSDLSIGESVLVRNITAHCGLTYIDQRINGTYWVAVDADPSVVDWMPAGWAAFEDEFERIDLTVTLVAEDQLQASPDPDVQPSTYRSTEQPLGCD